MVLKTLSYPPVIDRYSKITVPLHEAVRGSLAGHIDFVGEDTGGCAKVMFARTRAAKIGLAIKVPLSTDPACLDQISAEAAVLSVLHHPNVVKLFASRKDPVPYLVLELLNGHPLDPFSLSLRDFLVALEQVSNALEAAAAVPVVHLDVKPDNVIVTKYSFDSNGIMGERLRVKLIDFGLAKMAGRYDSNGLCRGTAEYMSPEHAQDPDLIDPSMDLFSLAFMLYERLYGDYIFKMGADQKRADYDREVMLKNIQGDVPTINPTNLRGEYIPPRLVQLAKEGKEPNPKDRISSVSEFRQRLVECLDLVA